MRAKLVKDVQVARIGASQHGVISTAQLSGVGLDSDAITRRTRAGRLHRIHQGVYAVGHRGLGIEGRWMAAVLACGRGAVLSHRSAAALWRLLPIANGRVTVSVPVVGGRAKRPGIRLYRSSTLIAGQVTRRLRIPVTTPARTIADLRRTAPPSLLRRAIREAELLGLETGIEEAVPERSELERLFMRLCRHRLSMPEVNVPVGRFTVDFLWRERALIVETDGYRFHRGRQAFEDDRARDVELRMQGFEVIRFSYRQVTQDPNGVAAALRATLNS